MSKVIEKSIALLSVIKPTEEKEEWSATEISKELKIPVQTVHRLLSSLEESGFVYKNAETKKFRLGLTLLKLGISIRDNLLVRNIALPHMSKLSNRINETVYLTVPEGVEGVFIDCTTPPQTYLKDYIGMRYPLCHGASSKVILAHMNRDTRERIIKNLIEKEIVKDREKLEENLRMIKQCRIAISNGEVVEAVTSVAAPIFSWEDKVVASVSIVSFDKRMSESEIIHMMELIEKTADIISDELGFIRKKGQSF